MVWQTVDSLIELTKTPELLQANIDARITKGALYFTFSQTATGIEYLKELWDESNRSASNKNRFRLLNNIAYGYINLAEYSQSLEYALQSYYLSQESQDSMWIKSSAMKVGQSFLLLGRKDQATPYLAEALDIAYAEDDKIRIIQISNNLLDANNVSWKRAL